MDKYKLAILTSCPIQYQAPLFKEMAKNSKIDLKVHFCSDFGINKSAYDAGFGKEIKWDIPLLDGYKYEFLKNYSLKPSETKFWGQINFGVILEIIKEKYDGILILGWNSFTNWLAFLTAFLIKTPILLRGENPLNQELLKPEWKIKIKKIILGTLFKFISGFLYIGEENKKFYQYYGAPEKKLFFAPYAVDNERYIAAKKELVIKNYELRKKSGIGRNDVIILFVGKFIEKKRPFDLLRAYHNLIIHNSKFIIHLLFVGDGALRTELENYVKENNLHNVHFVGFKNQTELPQYYAMADIFVLPSGEGETWGLVVNEAMCFDLPVIVSNVVGCGSDLVKNGENGYIFPLGDIKKMSEYLEELANNNKERKLFGKKSFEIIQNYNYQKNIDGILSALAKINKF